MATPNIGFLTPELQAEQLGIERKRRLADMLLAQGMQPQEQGRMVGRFYVPSSPLQGLSRAFAMQLGMKGQENADEATKQLYQRGLDLQSQAAQDFVTQASGAPNEQAFNTALMGYATRIGQPGIGIAPAIALAQRNMQLRSVGLQPGAAGAPQGMAAPQPGVGGIAGAQGAPMGQGAVPGQAPPQPALGNVPPNVAAMLLSPDAGIQKLGQAILEQGKPVVGREGAPILEKQPDGTFRVAFYAPKTEPGIQLNLGPNGQMIGASSIPGYNEAKGALAGAEEGAKAQYRTVDVPVGGGATRPVLASQLPQVLGGQPQRQTVPIPGKVPPEDMGAFNAVASGQVPSAYGRSQTTAEKAESTEYGQSLGKQAGEVNAMAGNAAISNRYLDAMQEYAKDFQPGKLAPLQSSLVQWGQAIGVPLSEEDKKQAGSIQGLTSMAIRMAGTATRQSDAQPSQIQFLKTLEAMPNAERTPDGFQKIVAYLRDTNNQAIAKAQSLQQWKTQHGTADGFDAAWPEMAKKLPFVWNQKQPSAVSGGSLNTAEQQELEQLRSRFGLKLPNGR